MLNLTDCIKSAVLTAPANSWPTYDGQNLKRNQYVTASEASTCIRSLAFQKKKERYTTEIPNFWETVDEAHFQKLLEDMGPNDPRGYFTRGHNVEAWIVEQLRAVEQEDEFFMFLGEDQISFHNAVDRVSGTPDGMYYNKATQELWLLEFKSAKTPVSEPRYSHRTQVQVNMGLIQSLRSDPKFIELVGGDLPETFAGAKILYIDPSHYLTLQEFEVPYDGGLLYNRAKNVAKALFKGAELTPPEKLKPKGLETNGCYFCDFKNECATVEHAKRDEANTARLRALIDKESGGLPPAAPVFASDTPRKQVMDCIVRYDEFSNQEKEAKKQKERLKSSIKDWLATQTGTKATFQDGGSLVNVSLSYSERKGGLDAAAIEAKLQEMGADISDYTKASIDIETLRVTVKLVKPEPSEG